MADNFEVKETPSNNPEVDKSPTYRIISKQELGYVWIADDMRDKLLTEMVCEAMNDAFSQGFAAGEADRATRFRQLLGLR